MTDYGPFSSHRGYTVYRDSPQSRQAQALPTNGASHGAEAVDPEFSGIDGSGSQIVGLERSSVRPWADPDWSIIEDRRGDLPEFPLNEIPKSCGDWVERAAHGVGVTPAHVAVPLLGIASSLIGTAVRVRPSRSWTQPMTMWTAIVGFSGTGKTPGIDATKLALAQIERDRKSKIAELRRAHEERKEAAKALRNQWKEEVKRAAKAKVVSLSEYKQKISSEPPMPAEAVDPGPFIAPRLFVSNVTIERMAVLLQKHGMLMISDELSALFLNMSRYSGGQDNEFWLEAWNGNAYTVECMQRPPIALDYLLLGLVGGLQPDKLARSFKGDLDGMYARMLFSWPAEPSYRPLTNEVTEVEPEIINALTRIIDITGGVEAFTPRLIPLSSEAVDVFEDFRESHHSIKQGLDGREREWWAKTPAHVLRLCGTLCILEWGFSGGPLPEQIEARHLESVVRLIKEYFWPHARAALRQIGLRDRHANARRLLCWIRSHAKLEVSLKEARREALGQSLDAEQTEELLNGLVKAGWLRRCSTKTGGRPKHRWEVNPKLFTESSAESAERI
jgi:hypothetical protein